MRYRQALRRRRTAPRRWSLTAAHRRELGISAVDGAFCPSITAVVCFRPNIVRQVQFRLLHMSLPSEPPLPFTLAERAWLRQELGVHFGAGPQIAAPRRPIHARPRPD